MTRGWRIARNIALGMAALLVVVVVAAWFAVQSDWFRNYVRETIVSSVEDGIGGRVEVGDFRFDPGSLHAVVRDFVIHGKEGAADPPFVAIERVELYLRLFTSFTRLYELSYLGVEQPRVNVRVLADGSTNIPEPRNKNAPNQTALESVVDLAVGSFRIERGMLDLFEMKQPLDLRARDVQAEMTYSFVTHSYAGRLAMEPLYVVQGRNTPVVLRVNVPVKLASDRIDLDKATVSSGASRIALSGSVTNMRNPVVDARVQGTVASDDLVRAGLLPQSGERMVMDLDAAAMAGKDTIRISQLHLRAGDSSIEASGNLRDPKDSGNLAIRATLALDEIGRLLKVSAEPAGIVTLEGNAKFPASGNYEADGRVEAQRVAFAAGKQRIANLGLNGVFHVDPHNATLSGMRLAVPGGEVTGDVALRDMRQFRGTAALRGFDLQKALNALGERLPYDGILSGGLTAQGDLQAGAKSVTADARLNIARGPRGIHVTGQIHALYDGAADNVAVERSFLALPNSRLNLDGSLRRGLAVSFQSRDLSDVFAAVPSQNGVPMVLNRNGGTANFTGMVKGGLSNPDVAGHLSAQGFAMEGRSFDAFTADLTASRSQARVESASLTRGAMSVRLNAAAGLRDWSLVQNSNLALRASVSNGDLADVMALAGRPPAGYSGPLTADAQVTGTLGNPQGNIHVVAENGAAADEPFRRMELQANLTDRLIQVPVAFVDAPAGRVDLTANYRHAREDLKSGDLTAHVTTNSIDLARSVTVQRMEPNAAGTAQVNLTAAAAIRPGADPVVPKSVDGQIALRGLRAQGTTYGDLTANVNTRGGATFYQLNSNFAGSTVRASGSTQLNAPYATQASANFTNLRIEPLLRLARRSDVPARGVLAGSLEVSGTMKAPEGTAQIQLTGANIYGEAIDRATLDARYLAQSVEISQLTVAAGPSHISITGRYEHPVDDLKHGNAQFSVRDGHLDLARLQIVQKERPGIGGTLDFSGSAAARVEPARVLVSSLDANLSAANIRADGKDFGNLKLTAANTAGNRVHFALNSDLAGSAIQGTGDATLAPNYPVDAQLTFRNVTWSRIAELAGRASREQTFDITTDGSVMLRGPVLQQDQLTGQFTLTRLVATANGSGAGRSVAIANDGPVQVALDRGTVRIVNAHLTGPQTDIQARGTMRLAGDQMALELNGDTDLGLLRNFNRDIYSAGSVSLAATVRGSKEQPAVNGQLTLKNAAFALADLPVGVSNANGAVQFNGNNAQIRSFTADAGGGRVNLSGNASFSDGLRVALRLNGNNVRYRVQQGVSLTADADLRLNGTTDDSRITGDVMLTRISYAPQSDWGSMLTRSAPPVQAPEKPSPLLDNMKLDIRVRSAPGMTVDSSLAESLSVTSNLTVRGTANQPGVLGRVTVAEGKLSFFGGSYTVNTGTIAFYNPVRIEPVLDLSLQTQAKGVSVTLEVSGPIDNLKLTYTSDPPLQFQEIVALLATGKTPTSDPTLLANQPTQPQQSFQQMGESAILGQAVANPIANRLQRVFGVTQLKIDPSFTTGSNIPTAQLAMQQQITSSLTFTYATALDNPNAMLVRMEWAFDPKWSAVATRDQNGIVSLNFFYKRSIR
jgi:translocation and assembly module TamB